MGKVVANSVGRLCSFTSFRQEEDKENMENRARGEVRPGVVRSVSGRKYGVVCQKCRVLCLRSTKEIRGVVSEIQGFMSEKYQGNTWCGVKNTEFYV